MRMEALWATIRMRAEALLPPRLEHHHAALQVLSSEPGVGWISDLTHAVRTGYLHISLLAIAVLWTAAAIYYSRNAKAGYTVKVKASRIRKRYEVPSHAARIAALACAIIAAARGDFEQWYTASLIACAILLSLTRLANDLTWRHTALHQVNFLTGGSFLLLAIVELLPMLELHATYRPANITVGTLVSLTAALLIALFTPREWYPPPGKYDFLQRSIAAGPTPEEVCSWWNAVLTFEWLTPIVWKGCRRSIELDELPPLPWYDEPLYLLTKAQDCRQNSTSTLWFLTRYLRKELSLMITYAAVRSLAELVSPFAMYQLLAYISDPEAAKLHPVAWLLLLFLGPMIHTVAFQQYIFTSTRLIVRVKVGITQEIYHRAMSSMELEGDVLNDKQRQAATANKTTYAGQLQNLMGGDIDAITNGRDVLLMGIACPLGATLSFVGLYRIMGWPAVVGAVLLALGLPIPMRISQLMGKSQREVKAAQDARISLISEYLGSVRTIKYFAWEDAMAQIIGRARNAEQKVLWHISLLWLVINQATELMPAVSLVVMFVLYTAVLKQPLTAEIAFTALSLLTILRNNVNMLSYLSRNATNAWISIERLDRYFNNTTPMIQYPEGPLRIKDATFRRTKGTNFTLENVSIDFVEGGLNTVQGASGSGKTTLLLSILGETIKERGEVVRPGDVAFASQTAWLQNASIKSNILFNSAYEDVRYKRIIEACCLPEDLNELTDGDETEVGENGTALSGGQKARVALARALYSKAPLLLLDDIFSALDAKTAASVWEHCFCGDLLKGRTVVLVTQITWIAQQSDLAVKLEDGKIISVDQNIGIVRTPIHLNKDVQEASRNPENGVSGSNGASLQDDTKNKKSTPSKKDDIKAEMEASGSSGRLSVFHYMTYFGGFWYAILAIVMSFVGCGLSLSVNLWVSHWIDEDAGGQARDVSFYLGIYIALTLGAMAFEGLVFLVYANGGWQAAKRLHASFVSSVLNAPLAWFKNTPTGRVVNRFSRDMASLDNMLYRELQGTMELLATVIVRLGAVTSIMPIFILPGFVSCVVGFIAGEMYTRTAVVVKRLVQSSQSPVFSQFADDMVGMQIIRARRGVPQAFGDLLAERLRSFTRSSETSYNLNRWVAVRIDFATAIVTVFAGVIAISRTDSLSAGLVGFSLITAGGLSDAILYLVRLLNELEVELQSFHRVREYAALEPEEKTPAKQEGHLQLDSSSPVLVPAEWPRTGSIEFRNVTVRYDPDGPDILKDINLTFPAGSRVAVIGRTGSGKSTLVLTLLRFTHIVKGQVLYDGVDITNIPRKRLRDALTIIPQEAVLFNGTVGSNLDPANVIDQEVLQHALRNCEGIASFQFRDREGQADEAATAGFTAVDASGEAQLPVTEETPLLSASVKPSALEAVAASASGLRLDAPVDAKGENFSHGQRQVLSLCRALVRRSKLMLLDEATASMDYETDEGIQAVLRQELFATGRDRTLVTIAHRLRTIADYDSVVVMGGGRVLEVGSPRDLFQARSSFHEMVQHSGEVQELEAIFSDENRVLE